MNNHSSSALATQNKFEYKVGCNRHQIVDLSKFISEYTHLISVAFLQKNYEKGQSIWDGFESKLLLNNKVSPEYVKTICMGLISNITLHISESEDVLISPEKFIRALQEISNLHSKKSILQWSRSILNSLIQQVQDEYVGKEDNLYIEYTKKYVKEHYHEAISFSNLAQSLYLSRTYLSYLFKKETGDSFMNYLVTFRINKAKELMNSQYLTIKEIGEMVGYEDPAYFSRVFKNATGMSPSEYMKN